MIFIGISFVVVHRTGVRFRYVVGGVGHRCVDRFGSARAISRSRSTPTIGAATRPAGKQSWPDDGAVAGLRRVDAVSTVQSVVVGTVLGALRRLARTGALGDDLGRKLKASLRPKRRGSPGRSPAPGPCHRATVSRNASPSGSPKRSSGVGHRGALSTPKRPRRPWRSGSATRGIARHEDPKPLRRTSSSIPRPWPVTSRRVSFGTDRRHDRHRGKIAEPDNPATTTPSAPPSVAPKRWAYGAVLCRLPRPYRRRSRRAVGSKKRNWPHHVAVTPSATSPTMPAPSSSTAPHRPTTLRSALVPRPDPATGVDEDGAIRSYQMMPATVTDALFGAVAALDQGCRLPGCHKKPSNTDVHHLHHREHGGLHSRVTAACSVNITPRVRADPNIRLVMEPDGTFLCGSAATDWRCAAETKVFHGCPRVTRSDAEAVRGDGVVHRDACLRLAGSGERVSASVSLHRDTPAEVGEVGGPQHAIITDHFRRWARVSVIGLKLIQHCRLKYSLGRWVNHSRSFGRALISSSIVWQDRRQPSAARLQYEQS